MDTFEFLTVFSLETPRLVVIGPTPDAPTDLTEDSLGEDFVSMFWTIPATWTTPGGVTARIERKTGAGSFSEIATQTGTNDVYIDETVTAGEYSYRVRGSKAGAFSAYSNTLVVTIPA